MQNQLINELQITTAGIMSQYMTVALSHLFAVILCHNHLVNNLQNMQIMHWPMTEILKSFSGSN